MSDLTLSFDGATVPAKACLEPPANTSVDPCFLTLPLIEEGQELERARAVRFDRRGERFQLSDANPKDILSWARGHGNLKQLEQTAGLAGLMLRLSESTDEFPFRLRLVVSQYIISGKVRFPNSNFVKDRREPGDPMIDLADLLLGSFTISSPEAVAKSLGSLLVARGQGALSAEVRERLNWVVSLIDLIPHYKKFAGAFFGDLGTDTEKVPAELRAAHRELLRFCRQWIAKKWLGQSFAFDKDMQAAFFAHRNFADESYLASVDRFCSALDVGLREILGRRPWEEALIQDCREGLRLGELPVETALQASFRQSILGPEAMNRLKARWEGFGDNSGMSLSWLEKRGRLEEIVQILQKNIRVASDKDSPKLRVDAQALKWDLKLKVGTLFAQRREWLLAALAILEEVFGESAELPARRVFYQSRFQTIPWSNDSDRAVIRDELQSIRRTLGHSRRNSEVVLPAVEAVACGLGIVGVGVAQGLDVARRNEALHLGLGASSAALLGGGCAALAAHFALPPIAKNKIRNRYIWEGITAAVGAVVSSGIFLLGNLEGSRSDSSAKYSTDGYGP